MRVETAVKVFKVRGQMRGQMHFSGGGILIAGSALKATLFNFILFLYRNMLRPATTDRD